jgi:hypothetical protein
MVGVFDRRGMVSDCREEWWGRSGYYRNISKSPSKKREEEENKKGGKAGSRPGRQMYSDVVSRAGSLEGKTCTRVDECETPRAH